MTFQKHIYRFGVLAAVAASAGGAQVVNGMRAAYGKCDRVVNFAGAFRRELAAQVARDLIRFAYVLIEGLDGRQLLGSGTPLLRPSQGCRGGVISEYGLPLYCAKLSTGLVSPHLVQRFIGWLSMPVAVNVYKAQTQGVRTNGF